MYFTRPLHLSTPYSPSGDGFVVRDKHLLVKQVLPRYFFGRCKYLSFTRKLYRWGFRQADKTLVNTNVFKNPDFIRGARSKCSNMKSTVVKKHTPPSSPSSTPGPGAGLGRRRRGRGGGRAGRQQGQGERGGGLGDLPSQMAPGQIFSYPTASGEMVPMMMMPMSVAAGMMMSGGGENMPASVRSYMERMMAGVGRGGDGGGSGGMPSDLMRDMHSAWDMPSMRDMQSQMMRNQMMGCGSTMGGFASSGFSARHGGGGGDGGESMMLGMAGMHGSDMGGRDGMRQGMSQGAGGHGDNIDNIDNILLKRASLNRLRETPGGIVDSGVFNRFDGPGPSVSQQHDLMREFAGYSARQNDQLSGGPGDMYYSRMRPCDDRDAVEMMRRLRNEYGRDQGYQANYMSNQVFGSPYGRTNHHDRQGYSGRDLCDHPSSRQSIGFSSQSMGGQSHHEQGRR